MKKSKILTVEYDKEREKNTVVNLNYGWEQLVTGKGRVLKTRGHRKKSNKWVRSCLRTS